MVTIKVLGPGCPNCKKLEDLARIAVENVQKDMPALEATVEKVTDQMTFLDYGLMATPGLVINEKLVSSGRLPAPDLIATWIKQALAE